MSELVVASFNAHWGVGRFGGSRSEPFDVASAVRSFDADVVVLAEAWRPHDGECVLDVLAREGWNVEERRFATLRLLPKPEVDDPGDGWWSLAVLSRHRVTERRDIPLARVFHDPASRRAAISVTLDVEGAAVDVVGVHVSSKLWYGGPAVQLSLAAASPAACGSPRDRRGRLQPLGAGGRAASPRQAPGGQRPDVPGAPTPQPDRPRPRQRPGGGARR